VIAYFFLSAGFAGAAACTYHVAPAGRGLHRLTWSRLRLRAEVSRLDAESDQLAAALTRCLIDRQDALRARDAAWLALHQAEGLVASLDEQVKELDALREENFQLHSDLANATAVGQPSRGPSPAAIAGALSDSAQEFANATATAWRASA